ncbi:MAG: hypothetical protein HZB38_09870 [Planctomycetes bacterium]|nr:hypothetical protein [Planctomycetota bacterium]
MSATPTTRRPLATIQPGERVDDEVLLIAQKDLRTTSNGSLYIHAVLADPSGQMLARMWNASQELYESMPESGPMRVRGRVESYKGKPQFILEGLIVRGKFQAGAGGAHEPPRVSGRPA